MSELFAQLNAFKWRDVEFPCSEMRMSIAHDLTPHKYWGVDGARVEGNGRDMLIFEAEIPFRNGIVPGKGEKWGVLYPTTLRKFVVAFTDKSVGTLIHPEYGEVICRPMTARITWRADRRDGCDVSAQWCETRIDDLDSVILTDTSPIVSVELGALDLDAQMTDLKGLAPELPEFETGFAEFMRDIQAIGDTFTVLSYRTAGKINALIYRVNAVKDSVERAGTALTWPTTNACERMLSAAHDIRGKLAQQNRVVAIYITKATMTLAQISQQLPGSSLSDLIKLNPLLLKKAAVPQNTMVRYYPSPVNDFTNAFRPVNS